MLLSFSVTDSRHVVSGRRKTNTQLIMAVGFGGYPVQELLDEVDANVAVGPDEQSNKQLEAKRRNIEIDHCYEKPAAGEQDPESQVEQRLHEYMEADEDVMQWVCPKEIHVPLAVSDVPLVPEIENSNKSVTKVVKTKKGTTQKRSAGKKKRKARKRDPAKQRAAVQRTRDKNKVAERAAKKKKTDLQHQHKVLILQIQELNPLFRAAKFAKKDYPEDIKKRTNSTRPTRRAAAATEEERQERERKTNNESTHRRELRLKFDAVQLQEEILFLELEIQRMRDCLQLLIRETEDPADSLTSSLLQNTDALGDVHSFLEKMVDV